MSAGAPILRRRSIAWLASSTILAVPNGMRGLHGTLAVDSGITAHAVASALGHESFRSTAESYAKPEAISGAQQKGVLVVLTGGAEKAAS
jgi:hypothetical protein